MAKRSKIHGKELRAANRTRFGEKQFNEHKPKSGSILGLRARRLQRAAREAQPEGEVISIELGQRTKDGKSRVLRFGTVTVSNVAPDRETVQLNVKAGKEALLRSKAAWVKPGVILPLGAGVPKFRVDAADPKVLIRELNGQTDRGRIVNGAFVAVD